MWGHPMFPVHSQLGVGPIKNKSNGIYVIAFCKDKKKKKKKVPSMKKQRDAKFQLQTKFCSLLKFTESGHLYWKL